jgi:hypothetical protein
MPADRTYQDFYNTLLALSGNASLPQSEQDAIFQFYKARLKEGYDATPMWPRWMVVGHEAETGYYMKDDQGSIFSSLIGDDPVFVPSSDLIDNTGAPRSYATSDGYELAWGYTSGDTGNWELIHPSGGTLGLITDDELDTDIPYPWSSKNWRLNGTLCYASGRRENPMGFETERRVLSWKVKANLNIGQIIRIDQYTPFGNVSQRSLRTFTTSAGIYLAGKLELGTVYATYQGELSLPATSEDATVPDELFAYVCHAVYADFLRLDGQTEKAMAEEQNAVSKLVLELTKLELSDNNNMLRPIFRTHASTQLRNY